MDYLGIKESDNNAKNPYKQGISGTFRDYLRCSGVPCLFEKRLRKSNEIKEIKHSMCRQCCGTES